MNLLGIPLSTGAWLAPMTALAAMAVAVAVVLLRDHLRLERHAAALEAEVARLRARAALRAGARARPGEAFRAAGARRDFSSARSARRSAASPDWRRSSSTRPLDGAQAIHARRIKALADDLIGRIEPARLPPARRRHRPAPPGPQGHPRSPCRGRRDQRLFAARSLETADVAIDWVRDGEEALRRIEASFSGASPAYDVVLMDLRIPGLDSGRAADQGPRGESRPQRAPADRRRDGRDRGIGSQPRAGISDFLAKPYGTHDLMRRLAHPEEILDRAS